MVDIHTNMVDTETISNKDLVVEVVADMGEGRPWALGEGIYMYHLHYV